MSETTSTATATGAGEAENTMATATESGVAQATATDESAAEIARLKNALAKANSEAADYKKQLRAKMSDDEAAAAERDAKWAEMEAKLQALELEKTISSYKASYLAMSGYDEKLAEDTAKALAEGDMAKVFANQQKANAAYEKKLRADLVKQDPKPDGAGGGDNHGDSAVEYARKLGQQRAAANKAAAEGLKNYL